MRELGALAAHIPRQGEDLAPVVERVLRRAQCAGAARALCHQHAQRHARDDAVAVQEAVLRGRNAHRVFADHAAAAAQYRVHELAVRLGVKFIQRAAEHRHRAPARIQRAPVRRRVDARRQPGDDAHALPRQLLRHRAGMGDSVLRRLARADDRHGKRVVDVRIAPAEQQLRRVGNLHQPVRIARLPAHHEAHALARQRVERFVDAAGADQLLHSRRALRRELPGVCLRIGQHSGRAARRAKRHLPHAVAKPLHAHQHRHGFPFEHISTPASFFPHYIVPPPFVNQGGFRFADSIAFPAHLGYNIRHMNEGEQRHEHAGNHRIL